MHVKSNHIFDINCCFDSMGNCNGLLQLPTHFENLNGEQLLEKISERNTYKTNFIALQSYNPFDTSWNYQHYKLNETFSTEQEAIDTCTDNVLCIGIVESKLGAMYLSREQTLITNPSGSWGDQFFYLEPDDIGNNYKSI